MFTSCLPCLLSWDYVIPISALMELATLRRSGRLPRSQMIERRGRPMKREILLDLVESLGAGIGLDITVAQLA